MKSEVKTASVAPQMKVAVIPVFELTRAQEIVLVNAGIDESNFDLETAQSEICALVGRGLLVLEGTLHRPEIARTAEGDRVVQAIERRTRNH